MTRTISLWLVVGMILAVVPHWGHLAPEILALAVVIGLVQGGRLWRNLPPLILGQGWRVLLVLVILAMILLRHGHVAGLASGVNLLTAMLLVKLLECRGQRDAIVATQLGLFYTVTHFLYGQSILLAVYLAGLVVWWCAGLMAIQREGRIQPQRLLGRAGWLVLQALPMMLVFFLLFPRTSGPLWGLPSDAFAPRAKSGLSDSMSPGSISQLIMSQEVAFRVEFNGAIPGREARYWRGPVLSQFDGRTWRIQAGESKPATVLEIGPAYSYRVWLEPNPHPWLLALDLPVTTPEGMRRLGDGSLIAEQPVRQLLRYEVVSHPRYRLEPELTALARKRQTSLPGRHNPRSRELAQELAFEHGNGRRLIQAILARFRTEGFVYTLAPPLLTEQPVDQFLWQSKRGFCEHFAGAMTFLMRAAGVPARVVTGYLGGELNAFGSHLTVRQADAHAWVEVWLEGEGWVRVDPTTAVAPQRMEAGLAEAIPQEEAEVLRQGDLPWLRLPRQLWDTLDNQWNHWVLGFNPQRQMALLSGLGFPDVSWQDLGIALTGMVMAILAFLGATLLRPGQTVALDPVGRIYQQFCAKLARVGLVRDPWHGPVAFARQAAAQRPDLAPAIGRIIREVVRLRYGPAPPMATTMAAIRRLDREVRHWRIFPERSGGHPQPKPREKKESMAP